MVRNVLGTVHLGGLAGPWHQVPRGSQRDGRAAIGTVRNNDPSDSNSLPDLLGSAWIVVACGLWGYRAGRDLVPPSGAGLGRSAWASGLPVQVHHREAAKEDLLEVPGLGLLSVTVMFRTSMFAFDKSRLRNTTPSPVPFFEALAESFRSSLSQDGWQMPPLLRCEEYLTEPSASSSRPIKRPRAASRST